GFEAVPLVDQPGLELEPVAHRPGVDGAELAAVAVVVEQAFAADARGGLQADAVEIIDAVAGGQVDLAAPQRGRESAPDGLPAAVAGIVIVLAAEDGAVGVGADDRADAVGIAHRQTVAEGHAPGALALAGGELVGTVELVAAALEEIAGGGHDRLPAVLGLE